MYDESCIAHIKVRINRCEENKPQKEYRKTTYTIEINTNRTYTVVSLAEYILEKIDPNFDSTEAKLDKVRLYSQDGIDLKDSDLFFLVNFGTLYIDVEGNPFNYKQILHQYKICERLGMGRFGVVHKIIEKATGKAFALKMIKIEGFFSKANNAEILFKEQKALIQFNHNHVPYQRVSEKEARFLILQICRGISYCHQKGIVHRNLKPDNIFISSEFGNHSNDCLINSDLNIEEADLSKEDYEDIILKIGDFVISGIAIEDESKLKSPSSLMYRAPELLNKSNIILTRALDIWSIGIMLYMMIYGYHPFQDEFGCVTPDSILNTPLQFSRKIKISEECIELLKGLLEKDACKRLTIFGIFNHKWLDLPNSRLEHESLKLIDIIKAPKDHSFHQKIATLNSSCTADDMFFNQSLIDPPETIVENKLKQFSNQRKIGKRRQFRKTSRKLNNSFCDNVVTVFLSNKGSKRRGSDVFNSIFLMKPKKLKFSSQFVPSTRNQNETANSDDISQIFSLQRTTNPLHHKFNERLNKSKENRSRNTNALSESQDTQANLKTRQRVIRRKNIMKRPTVDVNKQEQLNMRFPLFKGSTIDASVNL